ncbi:hypothetical protein [Kosakonia sacchari]|uniref:hypothetical protein n=1 Tax=Kosakonia sacchari TaxID=1158459 RepID=UPI0012E99B2E|nr:hypothetical protein [Kosakonia sacchari]
MAAKQLDLLAMRYSLLAQTLLVNPTGTSIHRHHPLIKTQVAFRLPDCTAKTMLTAAQ